MHPDHGGDGDDNDDHDNNHDDDDNDMMIMVMMMMTLMTMIKRKESAPVCASASNNATGQWPVYAFLPWRSLFDAL